MESSELIVNTPFLYNQKELRCTQSGAAGSVEVFCGCVLDSSVLLAGAPRWVGRWGFPGQLFSSNLWYVWLLRGSVAEWPVGLLLASCLRRFAQY